MALAHGHLAIGMVTTDCADPSGLAAFWAAAPGATSATAAAAPARSAVVTVMRMAVPL